MDKLNITNFISNNNINNNIDNILLILDVYKAFDNIDLDYLDNIIKNKISNSIALEQWINLSNCYKALVKNYDGNYVANENGLPQGSYLAPTLFNFAMSKILQDWSKISEIDIKYIYIFADNVFMLLPKFKLDKLKLLLGKLMDTLKPFGLTFGTIDAFTFNKAGFRQINFANFTVNKNFTKPKILGIELMQVANKITINDQKIKFDFKPKRANSPFNAFRFFRTNIKPKFNYYYAILSSVSDKITSLNYVNWFKSKLRNWLRVSAQIVRIPDNLLCMLIQEMNNDPIEIRPYFNFMIFFEHEFNEPNKMIKENLNKLLLLAKSKGELNISLFEKIFDIFIDDLDVALPTFNVRNPFWDYFYANIINDKNPFTLDIKDWDSFIAINNIHLHEDNPLLYP